MARVFLWRYRLLLSMNRLEACGQPFLVTPEFHWPGRHRVFLAYLALHAPRSL